MLVLVGLGALFMIVFVIARAQSNKEQCDEKQYNDFLSEVRNWQEKVEQAEAVVTRVEMWTGLNHHRLSDIAARPQPDSRVRKAQADIQRQMRKVEHAFTMYSLAWGLLRVTGTENVKEEERTGPRQQVFYDAQRDLDNMIRKYVSKDW